MNWRIRAVMAPLWILFVAILVVGVLVIPPILGTTPDRSSRRSR
jgi:hypothetical protein